MCHDSKILPELKNNMDKPWSGIFLPGSSVVPRCECGNLQWIGALSRGFSALCAVIPGGLQTKHHPYD